MRLVQKKTHHVGIQMLHNRDSGSRIGLNGEQECFGRDMGTHNSSTISLAGETGKNANPRIIKQTGKEVYLFRLHSVKFRSHPDRIGPDGY